MGPKANLDRLDMVAKRKIHTLARDKTMVYQYSGTIFVDSTIPVSAEYVYMYHFPLYSICKKIKTPERNEILT